MNSNSNTWGPFNAYSSSSATASGSTSRSASPGPTKSLTSGPYTFKVGATTLQIEKVGGKSRYTLELYELEDGLKELRSWDVEIDDSDPPSVANEKAAAKIAREEFEEWYAGLQKGGRRRRANTKRRTAKGRRHKRTI
jgi:hypothetical protein